MGPSGAWTPSRGGCSLPWCSRRWPRSRCSWSWRRRSWPSAGTSTPRWRRSARPAPSPPWSRSSRPSSSAHGPTGFPCGPCWGRGSALAVAACGLVATAGSTARFLGAHALVGLAFALLLSGGFAGVAAFAPERRAWATGYVAGANALAWIVVNPLASGLTAAVSWRVAQAVPAAIALTSLVAARQAAPVPSRRTAATLWEPLTVAPARRWIGSEVAAFTAWTSLLTFSGAYFIERVGIDEAMVGWLLAAGAAAYLAGGHPGRPHHRARAAAPPGVGLSPRHGGPAAADAGGTPGGCAGCGRLLPARARRGSPHTGLGRARTATASRAPGSHDGRAHRRHAVRLPPRRADRRSRHRRTGLRRPRAGAGGDHGGRRPGWLGGWTPARPGRRPRSSQNGAPQSARPAPWGGVRGCCRAEGT